MDNNKILSTAENMINQWDLRSDSIVLQANPFQANINRLVCDKAKSRLFTVCQNESFVKVLDMNTLKSLFNIKFNREISCFDISSDLNRYAVGFTNCDISIRTRIQNEDDEIILDQEERDIQLLK
jgi:WD40 repeat protein